MAATAAYDGVNRVDKDTITTVILFCSLETIYKILRECDLVTPTGRICMPSGGIAMINLPIGGLPSFSIAAGPFASNAMHWGTDTEAEYRAIHGRARLLRPRHRPRHYWHRGYQGRVRRGRVSAIDAASAAGIPVLERKLPEDALKHVFGQSVGSTALPVAADAAVVASGGFSAVAMCKWAVPLLRRVLRK